MWREDLPKIRYRDLTGHAKALRPIIRVFHPIVVRTFFRFVLFMGLAILPKIG
jgi:hypothetical protein